MSAAVAWYGPLCPDCGAPGNSRCVAAIDGGDEGVVYIELARLHPLRDLRRRLQVPDDVVVSYLSTECWRFHRRGVYLGYIERRVGVYVGHDGQGRELGRADDPRDEHPVRLWELAERIVRRGGR